MKVQFTSQPCFSLAYFEKPRRSPAQQSRIQDCLLLPKNYNVGEEAGQKSGPSVWIATPLGQTHHLIAQREHLHRANSITSTWAFGIHDMKSFLCGHQI